jgi:hypothetical protein
VVFVVVVVAMLGVLWGCIDVLFCCCALANPECAVVNVRFTMSVMVRQDKMYLPKEMISRRELVDHYCLGLLILERHQFNTLYRLYCLSYCQKCLFSMDITRYSPY